MMKCVKEPFFHDDGEWILRWMETKQTVAIEQTYWGVIHGNDGRAA
jgi:hypothetical protein